MKIWVDADACPKIIKDILFRVAERTGVPVTLVANQYFFVPQTLNVSFIQVEPGFNSADDKIVELCAEGDIVITADIPLADGVVKKGAFALTPRGEFYDRTNIGQVLAMRNLMTDLRSNPMQEGSGGGPAPLTQKDREVFANRLDKFMARRR
ncbi:MAG: yaiI [Micavibrio sp.]|nr:yaiI [Micavibrio sp.]